MEQVSHAVRADGASMLQTSSLPGVAPLVLRTLQVENEFSILRLSREALVGKSPEQAQALAKIMYRFLVEKYHPDTYIRDPRNPAQGGDSERWEKIEPALLERWKEIDGAYQRLQDVARCAEALREYRPITPQGELTQARLIAERIKISTRKLCEVYGDLLVDMHRKDILTVRNCQGCKIELYDLQAALAGGSDREVIVRMLSGERAEMGASLRSIQISPEGVLLTPRGGRPAWVVEIPLTPDPVSSILALFQEAGLKLPAAARVLGGASGDLNAGSATPFSPYRLERLSAAQFEVFAPFLSAKLLPSEESVVRLLVSHQGSESGEKPALSIEGSILKIVAP